MNYIGKRIVVVDFESFYEKKVYDLQVLSITEYVRDRRFQVLGMAYRFLDDERTHWLEGGHAVEAWVGSINWPNTIVIAHNVKFDGSILAWRYNVKPYAWLDTLALAKAVIGGNVSNHSLKRLAEYLGLSAKMDMEKDDLATYCKNDVDICQGIYEKLSPQFPVGQYSSMDWTIRAFIEPKLVLNQICLQKGVDDEKKRREEIINRSGVEKATLSSNKQFAEYLRDQGMDVPTKLSGRSGKPIPAFARTDEGLAKLAAVAPILYKARLAAKANLLETRGQALLEVAKTGSFPFDVGFSGATQTHRYSGGSGGGGNPQNFTRDSFLRRAVSPPRGFSLVVGDFVAIEARLVAWLAKEPKLMEAFSKDEDVYSGFASVMYGRKIADKKSEERRFGKEGILGLGYNMGAKKFKIRIKTVLKKDISEDEAWKIVKLYRTTYSNVPKLWENAHALLPLIASGKIACIWFAPFIKVRKNTLVLPSGLAIQYPNLRYGFYLDKKANKQREGWHYDAFFKAYEAEPVGVYGGMVIENICQALAGELCKEAIERAENRGLRCVGQCHDEILAIVRQDVLKGQAEKEAVTLLTKCMEQPPNWMMNLKLKAEVGYGQDWNSAKV